VRVPIVTHVDPSLDPLGGKPAGAGLQVAATLAFVENDRLADRDQISSVAALDLGHLGSGVGLHLGQLLTELTVLAFEGQHPLDASQVQALGGQLLNAEQHGDVEVAVAAAPSSGACRLHQTLAFIDAQGLGVDAGQFGRHRNHIDGMVW